MNIKERIKKEYKINVDDLKYSEDYAHAAYQIAFADGLQSVKRQEECIQFLFEEFLKKNR